MPPTVRTTRFKLALVAVTLGGLVVLALPALGVPLPSVAGSGPADPSSGTEFQPVDGDGSLPERAPKLQATDAPLSVAERGFAIHLAQQAMPTGSKDVLGNAGGEVLAADLPPMEERDTGRRAMVSLYDYTSDRLHQVLVDLVAGSVVRDRDVSGLQLPPSIAEATIATQLALSADPAPAFLEQYRDLTGAPLVAAEQVQTVAGVWRRLNETAAPVGPAKVCGPDRCLQLLLALPSGQYLDTLDFAVDLSSRTVLPVGPADLEHHHDD